MKIVSSIKKEQLLVKIFPVSFNESKHRVCVVIVDMILTMFENCDELAGMMYQKSNG